MNDYVSNTKTIVVVVVNNKIQNLQRWLECWKQCNTIDSELVIIHNCDDDRQLAENSLVKIGQVNIVKDKAIIFQIEQLCIDHNIRYIKRSNVGLDIGAFQDVCKERLVGFDNNWEKLLWIKDDLYPMSTQFVNYKTPML